MSTTRRSALVLVLLLAAGCSLSMGKPVPSAYTKEELRDTCLRTGGWWRDDLIAGYCEYQGDGFL